MQIHVQFLEAVAPNILTTICICSIIFMGKKTLEELPLVKDSYIVGATYTTIHILYGKCAKNGVVL